MNPITGVAITQGGGWRGRRRDPHDWLAVRGVIASIIRETRRPTVSITHCANEAPKSWTSTVCGGGEGRRLSMTCLYRCIIWVMLKVDARYLSSDSSWGLKNNISNSAKRSTHVKTDADVSTGVNGTGVISFWKWAPWIVDSLISYIQVTIKLWILDYEVASGMGIQLGPEYQQTTLTSTVWEASEGSHRSLMVHQQTLLTCTVGAGETEWLRHHGCIMFLSFLIFLLLHPLTRKTDCHFRQ